MHLMEHYYSLNTYLKETYGCKISKLALSTGCTCPNRDGTKGDRGCIFCNGSGDFAMSPSMTVTEQIETAKLLVAGKNTSGRYIAYFQDFTGTYSPVERLEPIFLQAISHPEVEVLSIATRPDCLPDSILSMLSRLNAQKPVWVELGLQTIHPQTAEYIRRGFPLSDYDRAVRELTDRGISVVSHMIIGLPGETEEMIVETAKYIGKSGSWGIKLHLLHVLDGTDLAEQYRQGQVPVLSMDQYITLLERCLEVLPENMVVHRLTGDGAKQSLLAPGWSADKKRVLNEIRRRFENDAVFQGSAFCR